MKLTYRYTVHGFSGGMMLSNTTSGEWEFDSFDVGSTLSGPNSEIITTVQNKSADSVVLEVKYRNVEKTLNVSRFGEEIFKDEANAYGFAYGFTVKE